jgi:N6-adenosine-specific RNA methylase IME4
MVESVAPARVVVADPPWSFGDKLPGDTRGAAKNYQTMTIDDIARFLGRFNVADDALLFLWRVSALAKEAYAVCDAWGFVPKSEIVWVKKTPTDKVHFGMGRYVRMSHESCIIGARGRALSLIKSHSVRSVFEAPIGEHSAKPDRFFEIVEELTEGPRLELFARKRRAGWTQDGNELPDELASL